MQPAQLGASDGLEAGQQVVGVAACRIGTPPLGRRRRDRSVQPRVRVRLTRLGARSHPDQHRPRAASTGGALVDTRGEVVGILVVPPDSSTAGLALPIDRARDVASQLTARGSAEHGWLGVWATDDTDRTGGGAHVQGVVPGSPAADSGARAGRRDRRRRESGFDDRDHERLPADERGRAAQAGREAQRHGVLATAESAEWASSSATNVMRARPRARPRPNLGTRSDLPGAVDLGTMGDMSVSEEPLLEEPQAGELHVDQLDDARPRAAERGPVGLPARAASVRRARASDWASTEAEVRARVRAGEGARGAPPALGDLRHPCARIRLVARRGEDRPRPHRRGCRGHQRAPRRQPQLQAQPRVQPLVHARGPAR